MTEAEIVAAQVSRLQLAPGDVVLVRLPQRIANMAVAREIGAHVRRSLGEISNRVLILVNDIEIEKLSKAEIEAMLT